MPGISIHVVDVTRGLVAAGMRVEVFALAPSRIRLADATVASTGVVDDPALSARFEPGSYEAVLHVAAFYRRAGVALPAVAFLDVATYRFGIAVQADAVGLFVLPRRRLVPRPISFAMFESIRITARFVAHPRHSPSYGCGSLRASGARTRFSACTQTYGSGYELER